MSTCKECQWFLESQHECFRNGRMLIRETNGINPSYAVSLYPEAKPDDPACSHFKPREESPGAITFWRCSSGKIESHSRHCAKHHTISAEERDACKHWLMEWYGISHDNLNTQYATMRASIERLLPTLAVEEEPS